MILASHLAAPVRAGLAATLALASAMPAGAATAYACVFPSECILGKPCETGRDLAARLDSDGGGWSFGAAGMDPVRFQEIAPGGVGSLHLVSSGIDPDADAAALLTITEDGTALLTVQGDFPSPSAVTHVGSCTEEEV
ncbi:hypothetical protein [Antarcticimicrobium luteum]|uniref:Uncharacterized protein n=1 Tax=Antarcticimicrobium luteum TaxID=2547397 RepID=A0A4R5V0V1_9RHOB|nr:hypothetical protein [Antarcticimicrobium luteum]TDK45075.1 hypothetical protein E1832_14480 [Antarcticimicrobium luteum]